MIQKIALPTSGKMTAEQINAYRSILAFQLRAAVMSHEDIAKVLNLKSKEHSRRYVAIGRRKLVDCVIQTVAP